MSDALDSARWFQLAASELGIVPKGGSLVLVSDCMSVRGAVHALVPSTTEKFALVDLNAPIEATRIGDCSLIWVDRWRMPAGELASARSDVQKLRDFAQGVWHYGLSELAAKRVGSQSGGHLLFSAIVVDQPIDLNLIRPVIWLI